MGGEGLKGGDLLEGRILGIFPAVKSNVTNDQTEATTSVCLGRVKLIKYVGNNYCTN